MDKFIEYLNKKDESEYVKRALTDTSFKNQYQFENGTTMSDKSTNYELATLGDSLLKFILCDIFLDKVNKLTEYIKGYLTDKVLIEVIAKHYSNLDYLRIDDNDQKIIKEYVYFENTKYIATSIEAMQ